MTILRCQRAFAGSALWYWLLVKGAWLRLLRLN